MNTPTTTIQDDADHILLSMSNEKGKFAIAITYSFPEELQYAFERGIDKQWFTLVDVSYVSTPASKGQLMRVFRLTDAGITRLHELRVARRSWRK